MTPLRKRRLFTEIIANPGDSIRNFLAGALREKLIALAKGGARML